MGLVGSVPMKTNKGDYVVIFYGASVPYIIRGESGGRSSLVGESYMHGLMSGEGREIEVMKEADREYTIV